MKGEGPSKRARGRWVLEYRANGKRSRVSLKTSDVATARTRADEILKSVEAGIGSARGTARLAPAALIEQYEAELERRGRSPKHVRLTRARLTTLLAGVARLGDATPERVREALAAVAAHGASPKTTNYYRVSLHGFFAWLVKERRWVTNPVDFVERVREAGSTRRRRALTPEELERLIAAAPSARAAVYRVAATTGLRRSELRALRWSDVNLDSATLTVRTESSKNRREAVLPLAASAVDALRALRGDATPAAGARVFVLKNGLSSVPRVPKFTDDLARAKIAPGSPENGVIDFHALRVTFATSLARSDAPLALAQRLMRHSTPALTANVYTKLELHDGRAAIERLDALGKVCPKVCPPSDTQGVSIGLTEPTASTDSSKNFAVLSSRNPARGELLRATAGLEAGVAERQTRRIQNPQPARV